MANFNIKFANPDIGQEELNAVEEVLKSKWIVKGPQVQKFEEEFAAYIGGKYGVATNGCTLSLYLVLKSLNLKPKDEVIVPSLTWTATAAVVHHVGAKIVFADIKDDITLDEEDVKKRITKNTKAIIPVHYAGREAIRNCKEFGENIKIIEDSAHWIDKGIYKENEMCFSFYAIKNMTTVRGGMIVTNDKEKAEYYKIMRHDGIATDTMKRYMGGSWRYEVIAPSWDFDMTDVEAAIGRVQLKKIDKFNEKRQEIVDEYNKLLNLKNKGTHLYPILVENRDDFIQKMKTKGIQCGVHYLPLHLMEGYKKYKTSLPKTEYVGERIVSIPLYPALSHEQVNYIATKVKEHAKFS